MARCHGRGSPGSAGRRVPAASGAAPGRNNHDVAAAHGYYRVAASHVDDERSSTYDHHRPVASLDVDLDHDDATADHRVNFDDLDHCINDDDFAHDDDFDYRTAPTAPTDHDHHSREEHLTPTGRRRL